MNFNYLVCCGVKSCSTRSPGSKIAKFMDFNLYSATHVDLLELNSNQFQFIVVDRSVYRGGGELMIF